MPERIAPAKPQQNGRLERLHLTLLREAASPPARSLRQQIERLRDFQFLYNEERPHQALDNATPAECYRPSPRSFDGVLREPDYPDGYEIRRVRHNGEIRWRGRTIYVSAALVGEPVGVDERDDGSSIVVFGPVTLGIIAPGRDRLQKPPPKARGHVDEASGLAHMPTGATTATTNMNKRGHVLPMSPV